MAVAKDAVFTDADQGAEIEDLRRNTLNTLIYLLPALGWLWLYVALRQGWDPALNLIPLVALSLVAVGTYWLGQRRHDLSCWCFLLGLLGVNAFLIFRHPLFATMAFGILLILLANALADAVGAVVVTALLIFVNVLFKRFSPVGDAMGSLADQAIALSILALAASWLVTRPLRRATTYALVGWSRARTTLLELRERQGELYGTVRSLEEAIRRIEHMNNELLVARREAEAARALKARFVSTVSHEMRSPLNLVLGFSKLMALSPESYGQPLPQPYRADVYSIYRNCEHLVALIDDILDLSQIEAQRLPLLKDMVDLHEDVLKKALEALQPLIERKGLSLKTDLTPTLPPVLVDPVRIRQVVLNLLTNAVRLTERGVIEVRTTLQERLVLISVIDSGPGIPADELPGLFREFHQISISETRYEGGSGLGLSISKYLVELHGGEIWVESEMGRGTTFTFSLPLSSAGVASGGLLQTNDVRNLFHRQPSCLIVHDDLGVMRLLVRHLADYHVVGAAPGTDIASLVTELCPVAVLTTPRMRLSVRRELASIGSSLPILTCALPQASGQESLQGVLGYVLKPVTPDMVYAFVKQVEQDDKLTVLLVDDEPDAVRLLERMLTALPHPYTVLKAYDGFQALSMMEAQVPDIVFLDLLMPEMDGRTVLERMRKDERLTGVPVVIVSGQDWIEESATLGRFLAVECEEPVRLAEGMRYLLVMLDGLAAMTSTAGFPPAASRDR
ncbi:MAG: ATP-binding protein [Anaerolineae bacterium]